MTEAIFSYHRQTLKPVRELFICDTSKINTGKIVYCLLFWHGIHTFITQIQQCLEIMKNVLTRRKLDFIRLVFILEILFALIKFHLDTEHIVKIPTYFTSVNRHCDQKAFSYSLHHSIDFKQYHFNIMTNSFYLLIILRYNALLHLSNDFLNQHQFQTHV